MNSSFSLHNTSDHYFKSTKHFFILMFFSSLILTSCNSGDKDKQSDDLLFQITVSNEGEDSLRQFGFEVDLIPLKSSFDLVIGGTSIPFQLEDRNNNDVPDKMFVQIDLPPGGFKTIDAIASANPIEPPNKIAQVLSLGKNSEGHISSFTFVGSIPFVHDGIVMENDYIAYRALLKPPFGFDIIGKNVPSLLLDTVQDPLSTLKRWGGDILDEGVSLGIGGPALYDQDKIVHFNSFDKRTYKVVANGPLRTEVHIEILGIPVRDEKVDVLVKWQMYSGQHWAQVDMELMHPTDLNLEFAFGLPKHDDATDFTQGLVGATHFAYTHGMQSSDGDQLGMAILVDDKYDLNHHRDDQYDYFYLAKPIDRSVQYRYLAAWVKGRMTIFDEVEFMNLARKYAVEYDQKTSVEVNWRP